MPGPRGSASYSRRRRNERGKGLNTGDECVRNEEPNNSLDEARLTESHASVADPVHASSGGGSRALQTENHRGGRNRAGRGYPRTTTRPGSWHPNFTFPRSEVVDELPGPLKDFLTVTILAVKFSEQSRYAAINSLATENGLARVRRIVETEFSVGYSVTRPMFDPHCLLFLRLITDRILLQSLVLEQAVGTIYNVIYGPHGTRAVSFFQNVINCFQETQPETELESRSSNHDGTMSRLEQLALVAKALLQVVTTNQGAALKAEFKDIVTKLNAHYMSERTATSSGTDEQLLQGYECLRRIADIFAMGDKIASLRSCRKASSSPSPSKSEPVDLPGNLSEFGPRHDNDYALIEDIRILPTLAEIYSQRNDFLPTRDHKSSDAHHQKGILRLLDSQFRLLREDTSGLLRDAVRLVADHWETIVADSNWAAKRKLIRNQSPTPMRIYHSAQLRALKASQIKGLEIEVEFDQIHRTKRMGPAQRRKHWINSRALREGCGLVALVDAEVEDDIKVVFMQVSKRETNFLNRATSTAVCDVVSSAERAMVTLRFQSTPSGVDLSSLMDMKLSCLKDPENPLILVEFPALQYNQFEGILRCLQSLHKSPSRLPFTQWLTIDGKNPIDIDSFSRVPPPYYLRNDSLDLSAITGCYGPTLSGTSVPLTISHSAHSASLYQQLIRFTSLDPGQAKALVSALTHEVSLIQGPPGTGKSYVGIQIARCLLGNKERFDLGPLLCVCYTNHALDQFLTELKKFGITRIVRIGSRSQSEDMEFLSLDAYKKRGDIPHIKRKGRFIIASRNKLDNLAAQIDTICRALTEGPLAIVHRFLKTRVSQFEAQIREGQPNALEQLQSWVTGDGPGKVDGDGTELSIDQLLSVPAWSLTNEERFRVYQYCYESGTRDELQVLEDLMRAHEKEKQCHTALFIEADAQIFGQVDIVGVTTTGLANNIDLLRTVQAKVLICEEAGEVLESHVLTALLPSIEHAILIGDHLQLRPRISRLALSMDNDNGAAKYNLDESLFERLAKVKLTLPNERHSADEIAFEFPVAQLDYQRRMHPSISSLIRRDLYPQLKDHPSTYQYPDIAGLGRRLFWLDHENPEDPGDPEESMQSKTNTWEADMVTALVSHLCRQGKYKPGEIAVLTPYVGQLRLLKDKLENVADLVISEPDLADLDELEGVTGQATPGDTRRGLLRGSLLDQVRMATVDNFQGEEAIVVIVSLVRSNQFRNPGFLKSPNRINVLLSRAKHGMYIIGNAQTSCQVPMWGSVIRMLEDGLNIGRQLELHCPRHPEARICVATPNDFAKYAPEGGCSNQCGMRLGCGHTCTFKCHSSRLHSTVKCMEPCTQPRQCGHACPKPCSDPCGDCSAVVPDVRLPCGHTAQVNCRDVGDLASVRCMQTVFKMLPKCGHAARAACSQSVDDLFCTKPCGSPRPCGHDCQNQCWSCRASDTVNHGTCKTFCGRQLTACRHYCTQSCHGGSPCRACQLPCEVSCVHNRCPRKCSDPCPPCAEACGWHCSHREDSCKLPCAVPCDVLPCDKRCDKLLGCGHRCPGVCGEKCPEAALCQECGDPQALQCCVEFLDMKPYADVDVNEDPIIFLTCGHFYTRSTLDGVMDLQQHYMIDPADETLLRPKPASQVVVISRSSCCPQCRRPLRDIHRYNRIVKHALIDESTKRFAFVNRWQAQNVEEDLGSAEIKAAVVSHEASAISLQIEQPFARVNDLLASAVARTGALSGDPSPFEELAVLTGFQLRGDYYASIQQNAMVSSQIRVTFCDKINNHDAIKGKFIAERLQAMVYYVLISRLCHTSAAAQANPTKPPATALGQDKIIESLQECETVFRSYESILVPYRKLMEDAKRYCSGGAFYNPVTVHEKQQIYRAMATQFTGTGHWYYCRNRHPFTVGECGLPMEEAQCPQCGERVGGQSHVAAAGVHRAQDFEAQFGGVLE
ncbi:hypothetical protein BJY00DRAFT_325758 [Aspergillus carlsbadensis]|nr:hypothetical protein BJY00DRAFT_325758 [Aspergillus carlsbadensis]